MLIYNKSQANLTAVFDVIDQDCGGYIDIREMLEFLLNKPFGQVFIKYIKWRFFNGGWRLFNDSSIENEDSSIENAEFWI